MICRSGFDDFCGLITFYTFLIPGKSRRRVASSSIDDIDKDENSIQKQDSMDSNIDSPKLPSVKKMRQSISREGEITRSPLSKHGTWFPLSFLQYPSAAGNCFIKALI